MDPLPDHLLEIALAAVADTATAPAAGSRGGPGTLPDLGRYRLECEIGRGGSGTVWRATDTHLDRPVAVKLLHPTYELSGSLVRRFESEGRTGSRLQHPGIAPVYDLGSTPDGRPYLVMKLVSGRTLAQVFAARANPAVDRAPLLALFAQLCQAVAYAHAQGVVHRDLKPGNVMVGEFGEVQVMDWGLSKVVRRPGEEDAAPDSPDRPTARPAPGLSDTGNGSVFGTPAYMAPEQAGGATAVDARADVFGLGAILFELLTGDPPRSPGDRLALALTRRLPLPDLNDRLADVDPLLARLVLGCLADDPADRPANGGAVADAVSAYLTDVQARLAAAELAERTARVEARERRRRRVLWSVLAATVLIAVAGGLWFRADRLDREASRQRAEADDERAVLALLADADRAIAGGRRAEAEAAVRTADGRAQAVTPAVRDRVAERLSDLRLLDRLSDIRLMRGRADPAPVPGGIGRRDREGFVYDRAAGFYYEAVFRDHSLDPLQTGAAERIRRSAVAPALVAALDAWAANTPDPARRAKLVAVAAAADPDAHGVVVRMRQALSTGDKELLARAADEATPTDPPASQVALARVLRGRGEAGRAVMLLQPARDRRPGDFWLNLELAAAAVAAGQPFDPWRSAAEALSGGSAEVDLYLGNAAVDAGKLPTAEAAFRRVRTAAPSLTAGRVRLGYTLNAQGKYDEGRAELEGTVAADPNDPLAWFNLGAVRQLRPADWPAAAIAYRRAVELDPAMFEGWNNLGTTLTSLRQYPDAEVALKKAIEVRPKYARAEYNLGCLYDEQGRTTDAETAYRRAIAADPRHPEAHYNLAHDLVYQGGRFAEAGQLLATSRPFASDPRRWERLALEAERLGKLDAAVAGGMPSDAIALRDRAFVLAMPHRRQFTAAADWYSRAFELDPRSADDLVYGYRYFAAGCAARAGTGQAADDAPTRHAELRQRARTWLRADLAVRAAAVRGSDAGSRADARTKLRYWQTDPNLAGVRGPALGRLPDDERAAWAELWAELAALVADKPNP